MKVATSLDKGMNPCRGQKSKGGGGKRHVPEVPPGDRLHRGQHGIHQNQGDHEQGGNAQGVSGYNPGGVDGQLGPGTVAAIKQYQTDKGLNPTGQASPELLSHMRAAGG